MKKNILAIQLSSVIKDYTANKHKVENLFYEAVSRYGLPDILFLPEVWTLGWYTNCFRECAAENQDAIEFLSSLARKNRVNIIGGSYIRMVKDSCGIKYYNTCPVIDKNGNFVAGYDKIHLYSPDGEADAVEDGNLPLIVDFDGFKIGLSICYDIRFPELFRSYMTSNDRPDLLVNLSAWPKTRRAQYDAMAKSRAVENQSYFLALSQTGLIKDGVYNSGYSTLVAPLGEVISSLDDKEEFIIETIDTDVVQWVRDTYPNLENRKVNDFGFKPKLVKVSASNSSIENITVQNNAATEVF